MAEFLKSFEIVNGFGPGDVAGRQANGMGCLAAQLIARFKTSIGDFYIERPGSQGHGEEYVYTVGITKGALTIQIDNEAPRTPSTFIMLYKK